MLGDPILFSLRIPRVAELLQIPELRRQQIARARQRLEPTLRGSFALAPMDESALLFAIAKDRDTSAFEQLSRMYAAKLLAFVRLRNIGDAESVVQEILVSIWRSAERYDPKRAAPRTWIYTIARNKIIDAARKLHRPTPDPNDPSYIEAQSQPVRSPETAVDTQKTLERIESAVHQLPVEQQEILGLVYLSGESIAVAAKQLEIPVGTAKSRIRLALQSLRTQFNVGA